MAAAVLPVAALALLPSIELALEPYPVPDVVAELREAQTVSLLSLLTTLRAELCVEIAPWARPWVTLWTFSLTSPSEEDIRVTPCPGLPAFRCGWSEARELRGTRRVPACGSTVRSRRGAVPKVPS